MRFLFFIIVLLFSCEALADSLPAVALTTSIDTVRSVRFSWSPNQEEIKGYKLYYKFDTESGSDNIGTSLNEGNSPIDVGNVTNFTLTGLQENGRYSFSITAYLEEEESDHSKELIIWIGEPLPPSIQAVIEVQ